MASAVGLHVASGIVYAAVVNAPRSPLPDDAADRFEPNLQLDLAERLEDVRARLGQELRRIQPSIVGVARTRKGRNWTMTDAMTRFALEGAVMIAAVQEDLPCQLVRQEDAARTLKVPLPRLTEQLPKSLGMAKTTHWDKRAPAFLVAGHLAEGLS